MADLTTLATVRIALPRLASVADAEIERLIDEATSLIESYCNRTFGSATYTEIHNPSGTDSIYLRQRPVTSITTVTVGLPDASRVMDADEYQVDSRTGELRTKGGGQWFPDSWSVSTFGTAFQSVQVVYVGSETPAAVVGRCLAVINRCYAGNQIDPALKSKSLGDASFALNAVADAAVLTPEDKVTLSRFRIWALS